MLAYLFLDEDDEFSISFTFFIDILGDSRIFPKIYLNFEEEVSSGIFRLFGDKGGGISSLTCNFSLSDIAFLDGC